MKKLKKMKWILTSVVLLGILTAGTSFALSDAGANLMAWYDARFQDKMEEIENRTNEYFQTAFTEPLETHTTKVMNDSNESLAASAHDTIYYARRRIGAVAHNYFDDIDATMELTEGKMQNDFEEYAVERKRDIDQVISQKTSDALEDLNSNLDAILVNMGNDIQGYSQEASDELSNTINTAKEEIVNAIDKEKGSTQSEIISYIDKQEEEQKLVIENHASQQAQNQFNVIESKASELNEDAILEMNGLIEKIANN